METLWWELPWWSGYDAALSQPRGRSWHMASCGGQRQGERFKELCKDLARLCTKGIRQGRSGGGKIDRCGEVTGGDRKIRREERCLARAGLTRRESVSWLHFGTRRWRTMLQDELDRATMAMINLAGKLSMSTDRAERREWWPA